MARIKVLSPSEAQKIAAGEVVERPVNVVKELIENALDAQATAITIYIKDGGKELIRVVDNGCGMDAEDAKNCFLHHATSKITSVHDLISVNTFGFRGEALSSISAVSKVTLLTREASALHGTRVQVEEGVVQETDVAACSAGTDITIADLFYNVPARKKFLRTRETEWRQIMMLFQAVCLDYISIHFKLISEDALILNCPPVKDRRDRIMQLWDQRMASHMLPLMSTDQKGSVTIQGLISDHQYYRYDRSALFFFVNGRWVKNPTLVRAFLKGYAHVLPTDRFPVGIISITIDPAQVDINIHPRKEEVQFLHARMVEATLQDLVKKALEACLSQKLQQSVTLMAAPASTQVTPSARMPTFSMPSVSLEKLQAPSGLEKQSDVVSAPQVQTDKPIVYQQQFLDTDYRLIGQLHKTYLLLEHVHGLLVIDQHAAHERIIYERLGATFDNLAMVQLLFPQCITMTSSDVQKIMQYVDTFTSLGIAMEQFGDDQILITATTAHAQSVLHEEVLRHAASLIEENQRLHKDELTKILYEKVRAQMACKAAIKAGDDLSVATMTQLLNDLQNVNNRFTCPHGRPTHWLMRLDELERHFKRKV